MHGEIRISFLMFEIYMMINYIQLLSVLVDITESVNECQTRRVRKRWELYKKGKITKLKQHTAPKIY